MKKFVWKSESAERKHFGIRRWLRETFVASEGGAMTPMTLGFLMIIITVTGFAVDVMRYDRERARLQYALDRAVLAAADLDQDLCPKDVIRDYLSKEGLDQFLAYVDVQPNVCGSTAVTIDGYRRVEAIVRMDVPTHFMGMAGIWGTDGLKNPTILAQVHSVAEESIDDVEISLVLDVSGSMNSYSRLTNLKRAATEFVQEMADKTEDGKLSISVIPYATQVAVSDSLMNSLQANFMSGVPDPGSAFTGVNEYANCLNFTSDEFNTSSFDLDMIRPRTLHFTPWSTYDRRPTNGIVYNEVCDRRSNREVEALQKDPGTLNTFINNLEASGNTSIDLGLKWGLTLLDQSFQPVAADLASNNEIPPEFATRPNTYASNDAMKVVVLMTDGANTTQYKVKDPYREGVSNLWWNRAEGNYSTYDDIREMYYWHDVPNYQWDSSRGFYWAREVWQQCPYGGYQGDDPYNVRTASGCPNAYTEARCIGWRQNSSGAYECTSFDYNFTRQINVTDSAGNEINSTILEWPDVWKRTTRRAIRDLFRESLGTTAGNNWYSQAVEEIGRTTKDARARALCANAASKNIVVFTIAFEAPDAGKSLLKDCSSDDGAYYEATGDQIVDVFASIGSSIRSLRLTQ